VRTHAWRVVGHFGHGVPNFALDAHRLKFSSRLNHFVPSSKLPSWVTYPKARLAPHGYCRKCETFNAIARAKPSGCYRRDLTRISSQALVEALGFVDRYSRTLRVWQVCANCRHRGKALSQGEFARSRFQYVMTCQTRKPFRVQFWWRAITPALSDTAQLHLARLAHAPTYYPSAITLTAVQAASPPSAMS
jgi:hypothetical protein